MIASFLAPEWIVGPMRVLLNFFQGFTGSYGLSIILLTLAVRILILPLTVYQAKSMKKMQELQPLLKEVQTKYKDQPEKLNQEMVGLYKTHGYNPLSGCLPLLIQMPFLYAIFAVLNNMFTADQVVPFLGMNLNAPNLILAGLTVASMFLQSYMTTVAQDQSQKFMLYFMPLMFGYITFNMKSGVVLYWVVSTIFGLVQQAIYPGFPRMKGTGAKGEAGAK